jgi:hypothetical protein
MFMLFLATPTIVGMIEKSSDTSVFFSMTEEEITHKHIESEFRFEEPFIPILISTQNKGLILSPQNLLHDSVAATIVIPPPEV